MSMLAKIRRMHFRDGVSIRDIFRRTGLSRNAVRQWLREPKEDVPRYPKRVNRSVVDLWSEQLRMWLVADTRRPKRDRRTGRQMYEDLRAAGYDGSYGRICAFIRAWSEAKEQSPRGAFVPMAFEYGEAFQFDWSCEYVFVGGLRKRLEVAHLKLTASRAFWLVAYYTQSHEMLFDAHARSFQALGGVPRRGIYDNMKTAVDKVGPGKERAINARFHTMCGHYLFEPEFCNRAAGWEKGIVEKNVQDRRRQIWHEAIRQRWESLDVLNIWLGERCKAAWQELRHPQCPELTVADVLQEERPQLMANPKPFDGYIEQPVRVSSTSLIYFQRNRYSVPTKHANQVVSLRIYPTYLSVVADGEEVARHPRSFDGYQTFYDWQHYVALVAMKPGALRNGAPFLTMPEPMQRLQRHLLRQEGGDRVMVQVLSATPVHGLEAVLVAAELALESGRPSGDHVLNILARLKGTTQSSGGEVVQTALRLKVEPLADVHRYEQLRYLPPEEKSHVD
ncbi:IS21 family transposase [Caballeronia sp. SBC2]|uniref:IS21 family transposase n=1 Tax=Caballeronia sp. SBC2 TaxID=2705547 RepID=UPI0013EC78AB|nr:IS21 family transposase [Caballeronia sp. SBC2]